MDEASVAMWGPTCTSSRGETHGTKFSILNCEYWNACADVTCRHLTLLHHPPWIVSQAITINISSNWEHHLISGQPLIRHGVEQNLLPPPPHPHLGH